MKKKILSFLLVLMLLRSMAFAVSAESPVSDLTKNGSLTLTISYGGKELSGGKLNLCKVADIEIVEEYKYRFVLIPALRECKADMEKVADPEVAKEILKVAEKKPMSRITTPIEKGKAEFPNLPVGLYLVWQEEGDETDGYSPMQPFLISVPRLQDGKYVQNVVAKPKVPIETEPTEPPPPPPPPPPRLPQTGQLNWPVPVMAVLGGALLVLGMILCSGRKRMDDEA